MANTEILNTLKLVREAQTEVNTALDRSDLTDDERELLERQRTLLLDTDDVLVHADLRASITKLKNRSEKLSKINQQAQQELERLKKVAKTLDKAARALEALVQAATILGKAGLL